MKSVLFPLFLLFPVAALSVTPQEEISDKVPKAKAILDAWQAKDPVAASKKVHLVYWTPSDREPAPGHRVRLSAIFEDIRRFYGKEMIRLGFGAKTFSLDYAKDGKPVIHLVKGAKPYAEYGVESGNAIREECIPALKQAGLDPENETIVIFCNMANWNAAEKTINQNSPYYASGTNRNGTAWQVDSPILSLDFLSKNEPRVKDGQYGDISVGKYNSIFIGGIAHELGHALGLPHNCERDDERGSFGTALMGAGNRTYGDQLRNEGRGSFLTLAHGLKLASHPLFTNNAKAIGIQANAEPADIKITGNGRSFTWSAKVSADPPVYAAIGYMDPEGGGDYDARTCTAVPDAAGNIILSADQLVSGKSGAFRVVLLQANGAASSFASATTPFVYPYQVAADGTVDLSISQTMLRLAPLMKLVAAKQTLAAREEMRAIEESKPSSEVLEVAKAVASSLGFRPGQPPSNSTASTVRLPEAAMLDQKVGYGTAIPNRLPGDRELFICGSRLFARGLYAHAPSSHLWDLAGKWSKLTGHAGIPDGHDGTCVFVIKGDGKELWRSEKTGVGKVLSYELPLTGVKELQFVVEDAGDGTNADWGCWFDPVIAR